MDEKRLNDLTVRLLENHLENVIARRDGIKSCIDAIVEDGATNDQYDRAMRMGDVNEKYILDGLDLLLAVAEQEVTDAETAISLHGAKGQVS